MAITAGIMAAVGIGSLGLSIFGMSEKMAGQKAQEEAAKQQAAVSRLQAEGSVKTSEIETGLQIQAAQLTADAARQSSEINSQIINAQKDITTTQFGQTQRQAATQGFNLDQAAQAQQYNFQNQQKALNFTYAMQQTGLRRGQMETIRQQQRARAAGLVAATSSGAQFGSGLQGAYGQQQGQTVTNQNNLMSGFYQNQFAFEQGTAANTFQNTLSTAANQRSQSDLAANLQSATDVYQLNQKISDQRINSSNLQNQLAQQQASLQTQHSNLMNNYAKFQADLTTMYSNTQTIMAQGAGQASFGSSLFGAAPSLMSSASVFNNVAQSTIGSQAFGNFALTGQSDSFISIPSAPEGTYPGS